MADNNQNTNNETQQQEPSIADELMQEAEKEGTFSPEKAPAPKEGSVESKTDNNQGDGGDEGDKGEGNPTGDPSSEGSENQDDDIPDEKVLKYLAKRGITVGSVDELKPKPEPPKELTDEEKRVAAEQKRAKAVDFGIKNKVFTQTDYDAAVRFQSRDKVEVVKENFIADLKKDDATLSDEDAEDIFNEHFFQHYDEDGPKKKLGAQRIEAEYNRIAQSQHGKVLGITAAYDEVEATNLRASQYKTQLDSIFSKQIPKELSFTIGDQTFKTPVEQTLIDQIKGNYLTIDSMEALLDQSGKVNAETLSTEVMKDLLWANKDKIISEIATSYADQRLSEWQKGRKGVIQPDEGLGERIEQGSPKAKTLADEMMEGG